MLVSIGFLLTLSVAARPLSPPTTEGLTLGLTLDSTGFPASVTKEICVATQEMTMTFEGPRADEVIKSIESYPEGKSVFDASFGTAGGMSGEKPRRTQDFKYIVKPIKDWELRNLKHIWPSIMSENDVPALAKYLAVIHCSGAGGESKGFVVLENVLPREGVAFMFDTKGDASMIPAEHEKIEAYVREHGKIFTDTKIWTDFTKTVDFLASDTLQRYDYSAFVLVDAQNKMVALKIIDILGTRDCEEIPGGHLLCSQDWYYHNYKRWRRMFLPGVQRQLDIPGVWGECGEGLYLVNRVQRSCIDLSTAIRNDPNPTVGIPADPTGRHLRCSTDGLCYAEPGTVVQVHGMVGACHVEGSEGDSTFPANVFDHGGSSVGAINGTFGSCSGGVALDGSVVESIECAAGGISGAGRWKMTVHEVTFGLNWAEFVCGEGEGKSWSDPGIGSADLSTRRV